MKSSRSLLFRRRTEMASSALDWIEECKVNSKWWIQVQSPSEETKATAPTPPVTPLSNGSLAFPFSLHWNNYAPEIDSPTSEDQVLECALLYRNRNRDETVVLLSNDVTLKIKAMAEVNLHTRFRILKLSTVCSVRNNVLVWILGCDM